jgi:hypothetical protein
LFGFFFLPLPFFLALVAAEEAPFFPFPFPFPFLFFLPLTPSALLIEARRRFIEGWLRSFLLYFLRCARCLSVLAFPFRPFGALGTCPWQTTRVSPAGFGSSALKRPRTEGTAPPVGWPPAVSTPGLGQ